MAMKAARQGSDAANAAANSSSSASSSGAFNTAAQIPVNEVS